MENSNPVKRFDKKYLWNSILDIFNLDKGIFKTMKLLLLKPQESIHTYLTADRTILIKPMRFLILSTAIYVFLLFNVLDFENAMKGGYELGQQLNNNQELPEEITEKQQEFMQVYGKFIGKYFNLMMLMIVPITSFFTYAFFTKMKYNYVEHFVINTYIQSFQNTINIILFPTVYLFSSPALQQSNPISLVLANIFGIYCFVKIFKLKPIGGTFASIGTISISLIIYMLVFSIIGVIYAIITILNS